MISRRVYQLIALASGFTLVNYGFNIIAIGLKGARELTSQFVGSNLLLGGAVVIFWALYNMLKPLTPRASIGAVNVAGVQDVGVELIVEEEDRGPKTSFYRDIEYIGYFFTFLGLVSAADLVLQVFIASLYNEIRFWIEILLVVFGVLSYAIFGSIGRLGFQEERATHLSQTRPAAEPAAAVEQLALAETQTPAAAIAPTAPAPRDLLEVRLDEFSKSETGEYERQVSGKVYDLVRTEAGGITVWREDRMGLRSVYLLGPYEMKWDLLEDQMKRGEDLRIGSLVMSLETVRGLLALHVRSSESVERTVPS
jgi:hypothetical protein